MLHQRLYNTYICQCAFLAVIHTWDGDLTLGYIVVIVNVVGQQALGYKYKQAYLTLVPPIKPGLPYKKICLYVNWCVSPPNIKRVFCYGLQFNSVLQTCCAFWCIAVSWLLLKRSGDEERAGRLCSPSVSSIFL